MLITLGRLLDARAKAGAGEAIRKLIGMQAKTARVVRGGEELERSHRPMNVSNKSSNVSHVRTCA